MLPTTISSGPRVLVLGAGLVAAPLVEFLSRNASHQVTVASGAAGEAERLTMSRPNILPLHLDVGGENSHSALSGLVENADVVVSLLPAQFHPGVADLCIHHCVNMVTASYVSPEMESRHQAAVDKGVTILNEVGLDPGMDHMSAMKVIDEIKAEGGTIISFRSVCGGLPAPEAADNPLAYKFSWSPRGVLTAAKNAAIWEEAGEERFVPGEALLRSASPIRHIMRSLALEHIPNRDSRPYRQQYGLPSLAEGCHTVYRGTLRYEGWCRTMQGLTDLGLLDDAVLPELLAPGDAGSLSWAQFMASKGMHDTAAVTSRMVSAGLADEAAAADVASCLSWLGVFRDDAPLEVVGQGNMMDTFCGLLQERLAYADGERDMAIMHHDFEVRNADGSMAQRTSTFLAYGDPMGVVPSSAADGHTIMAKTVGVTCAIATDLVLAGKVQGKGVITPVTPDVYVPALAALEAEGICFREACH